jgi:hypothetical protein
MNPQYFRAGSVVWPCPPAPQPVVWVVAVALGEEGSAYPSCDTYSDAGSTCTDDFYSDDGAVPRTPAPQRRYVLQAGRCIECHAPHGNPAAYATLGECLDARDAARPVTPAENRARRRERERERRTSGPIEPPLHRARDILLAEAEERADDGVREPRDVGGVRGIVPLQEDGVRDSRIQGLVQDPVDP